MSYLVVNIGCIECEVSSAIVAHVETETQAHEIAKDCQRRLQWRESGENKYLVFPCPPLHFMDAAYLPDAP